MGAKGELTRGSDPGLWLALKIPKCTELGHQLKPPKIQTIETSDPQMCQDKKRRQRCEIQWARSISIAAHRNECPGILDDLKKLQSETSAAFKPVSGLA